MSEKPNFVRPLVEVQLEISRLSQLLTTQMSREEIHEQVVNLKSWLSGVAEEIVAASSGESKHEAYELFAARYILESFLKGYQLAQELSARDDQ